MKASRRNGENGPEIFPPTPTEETDGLSREHNARRLSMKIIAFPPAHTRSKRSLEEDEHLEEEEEAHGPYARTHDANSYT